MARRPDSGAARRPGFRGITSRRPPPSGGVPPTITISGTVSVGSVLTASAMGATSFLWHREGVPIGGETAVTYTCVAADIRLNGAATLTCVATGPGGSAASNPLDFDADARFPDAAGALSTQGVSLADSNTTVDAWAATFGGEKAAVTISAPAAANRPLNSEGAGPGGVRLVQFDGVNDTLRASVITLGAAWSTWTTVVVGRLNGAETSGDVLSRYTPGSGSTFTFGASTTPNARCVFGSITTSTTVLTTTHRMLAFDWDGANQRVLVNNAVEGTTATTGTTPSDGGAYSVGANPSGGSSTQLDCLGWLVSNVRLTTAQLTDLRALYQNEVNLP